MTTPTPADDHPRPADDRRPGFLPSLGGYLRPGRHTAREGAAASSGLAGAGLVALLVGAVVVLTRRRRRS